MKYSRRHFLKTGAALTAGSLFANQSSLFASGKGSVKPSKGAIRIDPTPLFDLSPNFYMQFMEPLGNTEGSVEASWDYMEDDWRKDLVECTKDLAPDMIRWGGNFIRYYKWREGVGPVKDRPWMYNYYWGGKETNRVGTHELMDFCNRVGANPLLAVNFMSDGIERFKNTIHGDNRMGTAKEAADWVSYCNDPDNRERRKNGKAEPFNVKYWQIGNETSYIHDGFSKDEAIRHTKEFARAMKERDPSINLIGWGDVADTGRFRPGEDQSDNPMWAPDMLREAGEHLDMIAMHLMGVHAPNTKLLTGLEYQKDPAKAWYELLQLSDIAEFRLSRLRELLETQNLSTKVAVTEGHVSFTPHNANPILQEWLSAAYHARTMNTFLRHGDMVHTCTGADFCGPRWTVNAIRMPVPGGQSFLLPIGVIMSLYKKYGGNQGIQVKEAPTDLDIAATRDNDKLYLHILNTRFTKPVKADIQVDGYDISSAKTYRIAPDDPRSYVDRGRKNTFEPEEQTLEKNSQGVIGEFPPTSVSIVELRTKKTSV